MAPPCGVGLPMLLGLVLAAAIGAVADKAQFDWEWWVP
jgi:hypothetical protein